MYTYRESGRRWLPLCKLEGDDAVGRGYTYIYLYMKSMRSGGKQEAMKLLLRLSV